MTAPGRYDGASIVLHWAVTLLVAVIVPVGLVLAVLPFPSAAYDAWHLWHRSLGEAAFVLVLAWLWARRRRPAIAPFEDSPWRRRAAAWVQGLMLALLVLLPLTKLARGAFGLGWTFFAWHAPAPFGQNAAISGPLSRIHDYAGFTLIGLVAIHVAAALWHALVRRDGAFARMLPGR